MINLIKEIIKTFYPKCCIFCGEIIDEEEFLCNSCMAEIEKTELNRFCIKCGSRKKNCQCKHKVLYYDGCASPFLNQGVVRKLMYAYKFRHLEEAADYLSKQMALTVKQSFFGIKLDAVCCVPLQFTKSIKRGYNQSRVLAVNLAKLLNLPYYDNILGCRKKKRPQHETSGKERFENVSGVYFVKTPIKNKNILLVDDIKTTGATLSECAKQLLGAGSNKVYCITAVVTERNENKNGN